MKRWIHAASSVNALTDVKDQLVTYYDGDEKITMTLEELEQGAGDWVNDYDFELNFITPESYGKEEIRHIEEDLNCKLTPEQKEYVMHQASLIDFSPFEDEDY